MKKNERITVRPEHKALNNLMNRGRNNIADYRYLYTQYFPLESKWYDIFLNLNSNHYENYLVETWAEQDDREE